MILLGFGVPPQAKPPATYVDKGACPFECCTYRRWKTDKTTVLYATANKSSKVVGKVTAGTNVNAITGEVRTVPGKYVIVKAHDKYKPGDVLWVYTPQGEGYYTVWFNGQMYNEELEYMSGPFEQSLPRCEETPECWGKLEKDLKADWWVKIKGPRGIVGWTNEPDNFSNKDACG
jgi:hypothetical protein